MRFILAFLLFCATAQADNLSDLRDAQTLGLPVAAEWNVAPLNLTTGYPLQYHVDQVKAGHRFLPSIHLVQTSNAEGMNTDNANNATLMVAALSDADWQYLRDNGVPVTLRTNNLTQALTWPNYRFPIALSSIPLSPLVWSIDAGGLDDEQLVDVFGPPGLWKHEGVIWGGQLPMRVTQYKHPTPAYVVFLENNEGPTDIANRYSVATVPKDSFNTQIRAWRTPAELEALSLRMRDRVAELLAANPSATATDFLPEYWTRRKAQYEALYAGFDGQLEQWQGKILRTAYAAMTGPRSDVLYADWGYDPELSYYEAGSEPLYVVGSQLSDFTSLQHTVAMNPIPSWENARARNPKSYREFSLWITNAGTLYGKRNGHHEVMTPARYQAWCEWVLWATHDPGVPIILRRWTPSADTPSTPLYSAAEQAELTAFGHPELATATSETYLGPIMGACDRIASNATLREYWLTGAPVVVPGKGHPYKDDGVWKGYPRAGTPDNRWRVLECSVNPPRDSWVGEYFNTTKLKVWSVATKHPTDGSYLLYAWSPCALAGTVQVTIPGAATVTIPVPQPSAYYRVSPPNPNWVVESIP